MTIQEKLTELLDEMSGSDLLEIHNYYCEAINAWDSRIYDMDEFDEMFRDQDPSWIACRVFYGDFNPGSADYFTFNGYGNFVGMQEYEIANNIYISDIVDYIVRDDDELYNDEIREILDTYARIAEIDEEIENLADEISSLVNELANTLETVENGVRIASIHEEIEQYRDEIDELETEKRELLGEDD